MTIFNRKNIPVCSTFLNVLGFAELSQGEVLDSLTTPTCESCRHYLFFLTDVLHSCFQHQRNIFYYTRNQRIAHKECTSQVGRTESVVVREHIQTLQFNRNKSAVTAAFCLDYMLET